MLRKEVMRKNPAPVYTVSMFDPRTMAGIQRQIPALSPVEAVHRFFDRSPARPGHTIEVRHGNRIVGTWFVAARKATGNPEGVAREIMRRNQRGGYRITFEWKPSGAMNTASHYERKTLAEAKKFAREMVRDYGPQIAKVSIHRAP
jgi:hypothetical protein